MTTVTCHHLEDSGTESTEIESTELETTELESTELESTGPEGFRTSPLSPNPDFFSAILLAKLHHALV